MNFSKDQAQAKFCKACRLCGVNKLFYKSSAKQNAQHGFNPGGRWASRENKGGRVDQAIEYLTNPNIVYPFRTKILPKPIRMRL